ncbi:MAG: hypothetical protein ACKO7D_09820 [Bacteroidota bacterium]
MRNLQLAIIISFYLPIVSSVSVFAQSVDFKGIFFVQGYRNQKGIVIDSVKDIFLKTAKGTFFVKDCNSILPLSNEVHLKKVILRGKLEKGHLDFCRVNEMQESRYGEYIILEDFVLESNFSYSISDGSGNSYTLKGPVLKYEPVTKEMSSSGMYDGGVKKEKVLSENERIMLIRNFRKTLKKTRPLLCSKGRPMGSIAISFSQLGEDKEYCCEENKKWKWFIGRNKLLLD